MLSVKLNQRLQKASLIPFRREQVVPAKLANRAGVIGAAALMWSESNRGGDRRQ